MEPPCLSGNTNSPSSGEGRGRPDVRIAATYRHLLLLSARSAVMNALTLACVDRAAAFALDQPGRNRKACGLGRALHDLIKQEPNRRLAQVVDRLLDRCKRWNHGGSL